MRQILYTKYFLESATEEDKKLLQKQLLQITLSSKIQGNKKYKQGRGSAHKIELSNRNAIVKSFFRGGLIRRLIENKFLHLHFCNNTLCLKYRPFGELKILEDLSAQGIPVPKPLAAYVKASCLNLLYQGAIATEEIEDIKNFLSIIKEFKKTNESFLNQEINIIATEAGKIAKRIFDMGIFHVDLHLGNVLIDSQKNIFIIDFDRATHFEENQKAAVYKKMILRWLKSCKKYGMEEIAGHSFIEGFNDV